MGFWSLSTERIRRGINDPFRAFRYVTLGKKKYKKKQRIDATVYDQSVVNSVINPTTPLEKMIALPSDICQHLGTLHLLTVELNLKKVLELGTRTGESTITFLEAAKEIGGNVTSIDIVPCFEAKKLVKDMNLEKNWNFILSDDLAIDWNEPIDHLFIDTSHTYEQTLAELTKFEPFVNHGGIISLHDIISCPDVLAAIKDYIKNRRDLKMYKFFHNNGLAILRKS